MRSTLAPSRRHLRLGLDLHAVAVAHQGAHLQQGVGHPLARLKSVRWEDLADHDTISVSKVSGNRLLLDQALAGLKRQPSSLYETQHGTTMIGLVEAGLGVAAVPATAMPRKGHPLLVSVPLTDPVVVRKMGLIRRRSLLLTPAAQQLFDLMLDTQRSARGAAEAQPVRSPARG
jgi:DNA-binding transcriptional LysR family regulator